MGEKKRNAYVNSSGYRTLGLAIYQASVDDLKSKDLERRLDALVFFYLGGTEHPYSFMNIRNAIAEQWERILEIPVELVRKEELVGLCKDIYETNVEDLKSNSPSRRMQALTFFYTNESKDPACFMRIREIVAEEGGEILKIPFDLIKKEYLESVIKKAA